MKTWGKIILFSMPFLFLLLFLIISRQHKTNQAIRRQSASFNQAWNSFPGGSSNSAGGFNPRPAPAPSKPATPRKEISKKNLHKKINNLMKNF
jgi:hypothetical protein